MSATGLSKPRLERMHRVLSGYVERQEMPGLVALVSHHDDVHVETLGTQSFGHPAPMRRDTIFRIASITKPITAVAAMILVEECKLRLDESIEPWLPELANRRVLRSMSSQIDDTVPASRDHRPRSADVSDGLRQRDGDAGYLSDSEADPRISDRRRRSAAAVADARRGGMAAEARLAAVDGATGRAMDVSRERRCARGLDRPGVGTIPRLVPARSHLRAARDEGHRIPRASREDRPPACVLLLQSSDERAGVRSTTWRQRHGEASRRSSRAGVGSSRRSMTISPSAA